MRYHMVMEKAKIERIEQLVKMVKEHKDNNEAFIELFLCFKPLVRSLERKYQLEQFDDDDWLQEAAIICYKACRTFSGIKGSAFPSYYKRLLKNKIFSLLRLQEARKRKTNKNNVYLDSDSSDAMTFLQQRYELNYPAQNLNARLELEEALQHFSKDQLLYLLSCFDPMIKEDQFTYYTRHNVDQVIRKIIKDNYSKI